MRDLQLVSLIYRFTDPKLHEMLRDHAALAGPVGVVEAGVITTLLTEAGLDVRRVIEQQTDGSWLIEVAP